MDIDKNPELRARQDEPHIPGVEELTLRIKGLLESQFSGIVVRGEISGYKVSGNGHAYFDCKEGNAKLSCVIWRGTRSRLQMAGVELREGQELILEGNLQLYAPHGSYQLVVESIQQSGTGALYEQLEKLKRKLYAEGLFDPGRKKVLPAYPITIGVITSSSGAALHDITSTLESRWPLARVLLASSRVQGEGAAGELIQRLKLLNSIPDVEVIILGRGGGSIQDLWEFNNEQLAREIAASQKPVISAVGHETDVSISDLVADVRAATPTQAAVIATPHIDDIRQFVEDQTLTMRHLLSQRITLSQQQVKQLSESYALRVLINKLETYSEKVNGLQKRLDLQTERFETLGKDIRNQTDRIRERIQKQMRLKREHLAQLGIRLAGSNPDTPLEKGYARVMQGQTWVRRRAQMNASDEFRLIWKDGEITSKRS